MSSCSGPYTRVYLDEGDVSACQAIARVLEGRGIDLGRPRYPTDIGTLDDFGFDLKFEDPALPGVTWWLETMRFLGPRQLLRRTHVYEIALRRTGPESGQRWKGHLLDRSLKDLAATFGRVFPKLAAGEVPPEIVPEETAHEVRIDMCID